VPRFAKGHSYVLEVVTDPELPENQSQPRFDTFLSTVLVDHVPSDYLGPA